MSDHCPTCGRHGLKNRRQLTKEDHARIAELFRLNYSIAEVARRIGCSYGAIRNHPARFGSMR